MENRRNELRQLFSQVFSGEELSVQSEISDGRFRHAFQIFTKFRSFNVFFRRSSRLLSFVSKRREENSKKENLSVLDVHGSETRLEQLQNLRFLFALTQRFAFDLIECFDLLENFFTFCLNENEKTFFR